MPETDPQPPRRGLRLKAVTSRPTTGCQNTTVTSKNRPLPLRGLSKRPALKQTSGNVAEPTKPTNNAALKVRQEPLISPRQADVTVKAPGPKLRAQRPRRPTILSQTHETSIFSQISLAIPVRQYDDNPISDSDLSILKPFRPQTSIKPPACKLVPRHLPDEPQLDFHLPEAAISQSHSTPLIHRLRDSTLVTIDKFVPSSLILPAPPKPTLVRPALSLPSRRLGNGAKFKAVSKTVRWDPAIVLVGPLATPSAKKWHIKKLSPPCVEPMKIKLAAKSRERMGVEELVATLKDWKKNNQAELADLLRALREIESNNDLEELKEQNQEQVCGRHAHTDYGESPVTIRAIHSLDPRVPEFTSSIGARKYALQVSSPTRVPLGPKYAIQSREPTPHTSQQLRISLPSLPILFPETKRRPLVSMAEQLEVTTELTDTVDTGSLSQVPRRKKIIIDNPNECGRTVNAFDKWYADKQLTEFIKKFPFTGRHRDDVATEIAVEKKQAEENTPHAATALAAKFQGQTFHSRNWNGSSKFNGHRPHDNKFVDSCRRGGIRGTALLAIGAQSVGGTTPAGRHAAVIQQRLEYLLMKEKEKKVMEKMMVLRQG